MVIVLDSDRMILQTALDGTVNSAYLFLPDAYLKSDMESAIAYYKTRVITRLTLAKKTQNSGLGLKFIIRIKVFLRKYSEENRKYIAIDVWFSSTTRTVFMESDIWQQVTSAFNEISSHYDSYVHVGSGWSLRNMVALELKWYPFKIVRGGCSLKPLPKELRNVKGIIALKDCPEDKCFVFAVAVALSKVKRNPSRVTNQLYTQLVDTLPQLFQFPVKLSDVRQFEKLSEVISINVYGFEKVAFPYYISGKKRKYHVNLLLHKDHYYPIRSLSALIKKNNLTCRRKTRVCPLCLAYFNNRESFEIHKQICVKGNSKTPRLKFPSKEESILAFTGFSNTIPAPFTIYCDLETLIFQEKIVNEKKLLTLRKHAPISVGALTVCRSNPALDSAPFIYTGHNCIVKLLSFLESELSRITDVLDSTNVPIAMSQEEENTFNEATHCSMCGREFSRVTGKVRDHDHLSGSFRSALCNTCNLTHGRTHYNVNIFFHGLGNYDSHFVIKELHRYKDSQIRVIPKSSEKYLSFSINNANFKDSICFLSSSLAVLVKNLLDKGKCHFHKVLKNMDPTKVGMCFQKGIYPYSYMDSESKLKETRLPPIAAFKNDLTGEELSEKDYKFAQKAWEAFECSTMKDYMEAYLLCDVLLLADVFENFRTNSIQDYKLDPSYYFSTPHFTLDAFLKRSNIELDLIMDPNMYLFLKKGIRGGLSMVSKRHSRANHAGLKDLFNPNETVRHILYIDANNLYGQAMMRPLPFKNFSWMKEEELCMTFINSLDSEGDVGCVVECDLDYPSELHDWHEDYPLAPYKCKVPFSKLSPTAKEICLKHKLKSSTNTEKLMTTLLPRRGYIVHSECLKLYVSLGLVVTKFYRGIKFHQAPIIKEYIEFNSEKRAASQNNFDSDYYKLMSNSLFGKTIERPENRMRVVLTSDPTKHQKLVGSLCYKESKIINSELVAASLGYPAVKVQKPFYIGMAILELAKVHMYSFHYKVMKPHFGDNIKLMYTDTDSFLYEISNVPDINSELAKLNEYFDFSNYPPDHSLFSTDVKKLPGYFKNEVGGRDIVEFVGLRSKMYSFVLRQEDGALKETKAAKGVKKNIISRELHHQDYFRCLFDQAMYENTFSRIRSKAHVVETTLEKKVSLSSFDDKRYLLNNVQSLPYGHHRLLPEGMLSLD